MDSGEVAVENSRGIPSFGNLSTSHLKERYYGGGLHHHHRPHHSSPSSTMYLGTTTSTTVTYHQQPPVYHRYQTNSNNGTNTNNGSPGGTVYGPYTYQYPPHNHGRRGLKYYQHYGGQPTPIATTPSTTNSATQTVAPVNSSFRSKHTRYNPCSMFFSRGHCHYGANCRFSHDVNSIRTSQRRFINSKVQTSPETMTSAPLSAPALLTSTTTDSSQRYKWSNAVNGKSNHDELNSHDDEQFPQLRGKTRGRSVSASNQSPERSHKATSPFKKMVFRDAVLKQKSDDDGDATPDCSSSTKSSVNSDGDDLSEAPEDESSNTSSPTRQRNSSFPQRFPHRSGYGRIHPSVDTWSGDVNDNGPRYSRHMSRSTDNNYFYRGNHLRYSNGTIQNTPQQAQQLVHPQVIDSEHVCYVVQPEYSSIGFGSGVDLGYSMLSTQANQYVEKLDAQLLALEPFHQTAITSLQELARSLWGDAVLEIYGSNYTRLALPKSDVDCVLVSPEAASEEPSSVLRRLSEELKVQEWAIHVDLLDSAKIPVLKIVYMSESSGGVEVMLDVTCGHSTGHSGLSARDIIYSYQTEMPALRPLVLILKSHIQSSGLNCAFTGGLSSYALVLLAIRFLQACGDKHYRTYDGATFPSRGHLCRERSYSEGGVCNGESRGAGDVTNSSVDGMETSSNWIYVFTRDGKVMWRTGLGNLLLLFLETYITFDYRHYGISIENTGEYFALPAEKVTLEPGAVVVPYIVDPIKPNRSIGNCFRMHEIIQVWYVLYQSIASGVPLEDALNALVRPV